MNYTVMANGERLNDEVVACFMVTLPVPHTCRVVDCRLDIDCSWRQKEVSDEGLFKERMIRFRLKYGLDAIIPDLVPNMLDEARADIYSAIHVEQGNGIRRRDIDPIKLLAALDKWFGSREVQK